ncbi:hypothetical protein WR25_12810 [Diploscapter pachys]|uniref:Endoplasmic reticulum junction formation protein lunapark n=1 Tax=Diploscapter pachys TaxID=2018661 RepID=A0A2A2KXI5_9BILA|nr:hypothetical protein WR25_12810 [Diploscapter pachys]
MGGWLSRKKPAAVELESLSKVINDYKDDIQYTFESKRSMLTYASLMSFFLVSSASAYAWFHVKRNLAIGICLALVVVGFVLLMFLRKAIIRFYDWRLQRKKINLEDALKKKRDLLESVKETEKYKVAQELIEKYGDDDISSESELLEAFSSPERRHSLAAARVTEQQQKQKDSGQKHKGNAGAGLNTRGDLGGQRRTPSPIEQLGGNPNMTPRPAPTGNLKPTTTPSFVRPNSQFPPGSAIQNRPPFGQNPHPVRPFQRPPQGVMEKLVDIFFGDGPGNRLALICSNCHFHNGMALKEEYDSLSYVCYQCGFYNESKIARPMPQNIRRPIGPPQNAVNPNALTKTPFIPRKPSISSKTASLKARESDSSSKLEKEDEKQSQAAETSKDTDDSDKNTIDSYDQLQELNEMDATVKMPNEEN